MYSGLASFPEACYNRAGCDSMGSEYLPKIILRGGTQLLVLLRVEETFL